MFESSRTTCIHSRRERKALKQITAVLIVIVAVGGEAAAQRTKPAKNAVTRGWEKAISFQSLPGIRCSTFRNYFVVEQEDKRAVGENILVKHRDSSSGLFRCAYKVASSDFEIKNGMGNSFLGLLGDLIFVDSGTGANVDGLAIYNLSLRKKVYEIGIADDEPVEVAGPGKVTLWQPAQGATKEDCAQYRQIKAAELQPTLEKQYILDLTKFTLSPTGQSHCAGYY